MFGSYEMLPGTAIHGRVHRKCRRAGPNGDTVQPDTDATLATGPSDSRGTCVCFEATTSKPYADRVDSTVAAMFHP